MPASTSKSSKRSSRKPASDRFAVTFSKETSEALEFIRRFGHVDPRQFIVDHVESFLRQIWQSGEFGEHVTASYGFATLERAIESAKAANRVDEEPAQWFFFKASSGRYFAENSGRYIAQRVQDGAKIVATMSGWNYVEEVKE